MEPVATYSEDLFSGKRLFTLYPDHVHIQGKAYLKNDFIVDVELKNLDPHYSQIRVRDSGFWAGVWIILGAVMMAEILSRVFHVDLTNPVLGFFATLPIAGLLLCIVTFRKIECYSFINTSGVLALTIARSRKNSQAFDTFIAQLIGFINALKTQEQNSPTTATTAHK